MNDWRDDKILLWIDVFSRPDSSFRRVRSEEDVKEWRPETDRERIAFEGLIAEESRLSLKAWYSTLSSVNPTADAFRRILERAIGEKIPVGNSELAAEKRYRKA